MPNFLAEAGMTQCDNTSVVNLLDKATRSIRSRVLLAYTTQFYTLFGRKCERSWEVHCLPTMIEDSLWIRGNVVICQ